MTDSPPPRAQETAREFAKRMAVEYLGKAKADAGSLLEGHLAVAIEQRDSETRRATMTLETALSEIPDDWVLDHLCWHWSGQTGKIERTGGATCKLATVAPEQAGAATINHIVKAQGEGATLADAVRAAIRAAASPASTEREKP